MTTAKKRRERFLFDRFLEASGLTPDSIQHDDAPDFVLSFGGKQIAVEMTEILIDDRGSPLNLRAKESLTDRIVAAAQHRFEAKTGKAAFVSVCFYDGQLSHRLARDELAAVLADLVERMLAGSAGPTRWRNEYAEPALDAVAFVSAHLSSEGHWSVARAGWVAPLDQHYLNNAVARKNSEYDRYKQRAEEVWLLLVVDGGRPSQSFQVDGDVELSNTGSRFERTYFFRTFPRVLTCLNRSGA